MIAIVIHSTKIAFVWKVIVSVGRVTKQIQKQNSVLLQLRNRVILSMIVVLISFVSIIYANVNQTTYSIRFQILVFLITVIMTQIAINSIVKEFV